MVILRVEIGRQFCGLANSCLIKGEQDCIKVSAASRLYVEANEDRFQERGKSLQMVKCVRRWHFV